MNDINFKSFIKASKEKEKAKKKAYKNILKDINSEISDALHHTDSISCHIPPLMLDVLDYNPFEAMDYIMKKLLDNDKFRNILIDVKLLDPCGIYLQWDIKKLGC
jgi:hypothetical protein